MKPNGTDSITRRKADHISINLEQDVQAREVNTGFEHYRFVHTALPEVDLDDVDTSTTFLGHALKGPLLISSMTGGVDRGQRINRNLALAARDLGVAMAVGSQRAALEDPDLRATFAIREHAPDILLFANFGAVQLNYGYTVDHCRRAVEMIDANALILHLNPLQEALQRDGNRDFSSLLPKIHDVCQAVEVPVIVKEVGNGISGPVARQLVDAGVSVIDVSGAGGTSWSAVEHHRANTERARRLSTTFVDWGIPTATSLLMAREAVPDTPVIASGGIRTGLDAAKALALGADLAGVAGPLLKAADQDADRTRATLSLLLDEVRLAMFLTGSQTISDLKTSARMISNDPWQRTDRGVQGHPAVSQLDPVGPRHTIREATNG